MTIEELVEYLAAREEVMSTGRTMTNGERWHANLPELTREDTLELGGVLANQFIELLTDTHPVEVALTAVMIGVELGRELERRAV